MGGTKRMHGIAYSDKILKKHHVFIWSNGLFSEGQISILPMTAVYSARHFVLSKHG